MLATMRAEGKQGVKVDVDTGGGRSVRPGGSGGGSGGNDSGADPGDVDNAIRQSLNSLNRWTEAWKHARAGIADSGRAIKLAAEGTRNYNAEIRGSVAEMQRQRPLLNHSYADLKARIAKMRDFGEALRLQQQWMRQNDRSLSANAARWKSWMMAVRDTNEHATSAVKKFGAAFKSLRGGGGADGGGGIFSSLKNLFGDSGDEAEEAGNQFGNAGKKILGLSRGMWMFTGIVAIAAPLIGVIAGLLAGLPSLIGAFGAGIAVVALGMDGIKKAAEVFTPVLDQVKAAVSSTFQTGLTPVFTQLSGLLTTITPNLQNVAQGLVNMADSVTKVVTGVQGMGQIQNILDKTGEFFTGLGPVLATGTQSFLTLANAGANSFGKLLAPLQEFANGFNDMVNRVTSNGVFEGAMDGLSQTLGSLLNLFNRLMESGLQAMGQLGGPLSTFINGIGDAFIALMPALTSISGLLGNVLGTLGTSLAPIIQALTPAFTALADTLGTLLVGNLQTLGTILTPVAQLLGGTLLTALQAIQPLLPGLIQSFSQLANEAVAQLAPYIPQLATAFGQIAGAILQLVPTIVGALIPAFQQMLPSILQLVPSIVSMAQSFAQMMPTIVPIVQVVIQLAAAFLQVGVSVGGALLSALSSLLGILASVQAKVSEWVAGFAQGASDIAAKAAELPGMVKNALGDLGNLLVSSGKALVSGFINGIKSMFGAVKDAASGLMNAVKNYFPHSPAPEGPFSGSGWTAVSKSGEAIGQEFADGIGNSQSGVQQQVRSLMEIVKAVFGDASGLTLNLNLGGAQQQLTGITDSAKGLRTEMSGLATDVSTSPALSTGTGMTDSDTEKKLDELKMRSRELEIQAKQASIDGNKELAKQLRMEKEKLGLQMDQLKYAKEYGSETTDLNTAMGEALGKALGVPGDFAKATAGQFLSDIGISGNGMISKALTEGIKYVFNIGSVDEAMSIKDREESKQALTVVGRQG
ncbi:tape measure protein [Mycobacterium phage Elephantoon]|nr:tape measure protein [Mycobacterium phage Elephantoon]